METRRQDRDILSHQSRGQQRYTVEAILIKLNIYENNY